MSGVGATGEAYNGGTMIAGTLVDSTKRRGIALAVLAGSTESEAHKRLEIKYLGR